VNKITQPATVTSEKKTFRKNKKHVAKTKKIFRKNEQNISQKRKKQFAETKI